MNDAADLATLRSCVRDPENTAISRWAALAEAVRVIVRNPENMKSLRGVVRRAASEPESFDIFRRRSRRPVEWVEHETGKSDPASGEIFRTEFLLLLAAVIHDQHFGKNLLGDDESPTVELVNPWKADSELDRDSPPNSPPECLSRRARLEVWYQGIVSNLAEQSKDGLTEEDIRNNFLNSGVANFLYGNEDGLPAPWFVRDQDLPAILDALMDDLRFTNDDDREDDLRPAAWFAKITDNGLHSDHLRKARSDGRLKLSKKLGKRWRHNVSEVCCVWPQYAPKLRQALDAETGNNPVQAGRAR